GPVAPVDLGDAEAILPRQRLGQRAFHDILQPSETMEVECQLVVTSDSTELCLVLSDNGEIAVDRAFGPLDRLAMVPLRAALSTDNFTRHFQSDLRVDAALTAMVVLGAVVQDHDLITKKTSRLRPPVSDQSLFLGQFQLELVT